MCIVSRGRATTCGITAALRRELSLSRGTRHIRILASILADIEGGADSLAEIDFGVLARKPGYHGPSDSPSDWTAKTTV